MSHSDELRHDLSDADDTLPPRFGEMMCGHVLVAEDDGPLREMLETILKLEGHHVTTVPTADAMLDAIGSSSLAQGEPFDVLLTDVRMPGTSGLDVVERLRGGGHRVPIIVMTAFPDDTVKRRALAAGALLIAKPFSLDTICLAIRTLVQPCVA